MSEKKTITVTDIRGVQFRFAADGWDDERDGSLTVNDSTFDDDPVCASFAPAQWISAVDDTRRAPDTTARALTIAEHGLSDILGAIRAMVESCSNPDDANAMLGKLTGLAEDTLAAISVETGK